MTQWPSTAVRLLDHQSWQTPFTCTTPVVLKALPGTSGHGDPTVDSVEVGACCQSYLGRPRNNVGLRKTRSPVHGPTGVGGLGNGVLGQEEAFRFLVLLSPQNLLDACC